MKWLLVFLNFLFLLKAPSGFAQDSSSKLSVALSPALFVPVSVAVQGSLQLRLNSKWSLLAEGAYPTFYPQNTDYEKIRYWRAGFEIKRFVSNGESSRYVSLQNNFLFRELTDNDNGTYYTKTETYAYNLAVIKSPVWSTALKYGAEVPLGKKTYVDLFAGAGIRMVFTKYNTETALLTSILPEERSFLDFDDAWLYNYTLLRLHLTAGFRFGIRL